MAQQERSNACDTLTPQFREAASAHFEKLGIDVEFTTTCRKQRVKVIGGGWVTVVHIAAQLDIPLLGQAYYYPSGLGMVLRYGITDPQVLESMRDGILIQALGEQGKSVDVTDQVLSNGNSHGRVSAHPLEEMRTEGRVEVNPVLNWYLVS